MGTPDFDEAAYMKFLPSAGIRRADGEALIEKMAAGEMDAEVTIEMETKIRRSSMVAVDIKERVTVLCLFPVTTTPGTRNYR